MGKRIFGELPGVHEGAEFPSRKELHAAGVHLPTQAGISGSANEGADSIVLSGGYEDDHDEGDVIVYTGHGGRDQQTGKQVADQTLTQGKPCACPQPPSGLARAGHSGSSAPLALLATGGVSVRRPVPGG